MIRLVLLTDIIAIDPGLASGVAHVAVTPSAFNIVSTDELAPIETGEWLENALHLVPDLATTAVVIERFIITAKTARNSQAPWSLEIIGQTDWILSRFDRNRKATKQNIADSLAAFSNDRLRAYGLWHRGGKGHAVEALRHAALHAQNTRNLPPKLGSQQA